MKCETETLGAFLYRVAMGGFRYGYFRYAVMEVPQGKDLAAIDRKLIEKYGVVRCRMKRLRQRQQGFASMQYMRFGYSFILMATDGEHTAFDKEQSFDARLRPLLFCGYTVGLRGSEVSVEVEGELWKDVTRKFKRIALCDRTMLETKVNSLPFYRFPGAQKQKRELVKVINHRRRKAGLKPIKMAERKADQNCWQQRRQSAS